MLSRSAANCMAARSPIVGSFVTSCAAARPRPAGRADPIARYAARASSMSNAASTPSSACRQRIRFGGVAKCSSAAAKGAHSNTMPRFVLHATASRVRSIARSIRTPTLTSRANSGSIAASALAMKSSARMPCPGESMLTLPGLRTTTSSWQAHRNAARASLVAASAAVGAGGTVNNTSGNVRRPSRDVAETAHNRELARQQVVDQMGGDVKGSHCLQAAPRGDPIDLDHLRRVRGWTVAVPRQQIDAPVVQAKRGGGLYRDIGNFQHRRPRNGLWFAARTLGDVADPVLAHAPHRCDGTPTNHEYAPIETRSGSRLDVLLQVSQPAVLLKRRQRREFAVDLPHLSQAIA